MPLAGRGRAPAMPDAWRQGQRRAARQSQRAQARRALRPVHRNRPLYSRDELRGGVADAGDGGRSKSEKQKNERTTPCNGNSGRACRPARGDGRTGSDASPPPAVILAKAGIHVSAWSSLYWFALRLPVDSRLRGNDDACAGNGHEWAGNDEERGGNDDKGRRNGDEWPRNDDEGSAGGGAGDAGKNRLQPPFSFRRYRALSESRQSG